MSRRSGASHAFHLYVVRFDVARLGVTRDDVFAALRAENIGINVHYVPVHLHPYYQRVLGTGPGLCPNAESAYNEIISLPMFSSMSDDDADDVIHAVQKVVAAFAGSGVSP